MEKFIKSIPVQIQEMGHWKMPFIALPTEQAIANHLLKVNSRVTKITIKLPKGSQNDKRQNGSTN